MATDKEALEIQQRFRTRSLALCGNEFDAVTSCKGSACDGAKAELLNCMQSKVCEILHHSLQECVAAKQDCKHIHANLNRCLAFAYSSLPPPKA